MKSWTFELGLNIDIRHWNTSLETKNDVMELSGFDEKQNCMVFGYLSNTK